MICELYTNEEFLHRGKNCVALTAGDFWDHSHGVCDNFLPSWEQIDIMLVIQVWVGCYDCNTHFIFIIYESTHKNVFIYAFAKYQRIISEIVILFIGVYELNLLILTWFFFQASR